ncbi:hypothetical protein HPB49_003149 [Dermacentor silvarum]|uniref:Uncharacterized protein n=1 Tax=Dermacentor silvarum TaxID=543639 RepID=A0ACB8DT92_DERSI|nr:hypothetical protein HPB49_003149 [Dermacentor silvarum]
MISDGLGPHFKKKVIEELSWPEVYYSIQIDETPKPEQRVQQLDVLVRYFSRKQQKVVIEHLESFNLGRATADIIIDCVERSITELPKEKLLCFFSDGPNTMKSVKKLKDAVHRNILDIGECNLHKILPCLVTVEETVKSIKYVVASVPHMINGKQVTSLVDEWHSLHCKPMDERAASSNSNIDSYWADVLADGQYPLLSVFIRALLSLPHGNAECERGFSENKRIIDNRANLGIVTLNGIRHVKSYLKRFDSDVSQVPVTQELINAAKHSHKKYLDRLQLEAEDKERRKRNASADSVTHKKVKLEEEKHCLEGRLESSKAMLQRAQGLIKGGLDNKNMEDIECGQVLLAEANAALAENMRRLADINKKLQQF